MPRRKPHELLGGGNPAPFKKKVASQMREVSAVGQAITTVARSPLKHGKAALTGKFRKTPAAKIMSGK